MKLKPKSKCNINSGFSLLEMLVAITLSILLTGAILQSYLSIKKIYQVQNEIIDLSENIRFAEFFLRQNIMHAGFAGCRAISELNLVDHAYLKEFETIHGYDYPQLPDYLLDKQIAKDTDVIIVTKANADVTTLVGDTKIATKFVRVKQNPVTEANPLLMISDCINADLVSVQNWQSNNIYLEQALQNPYRAINTFVGRFEEIAFFIGKTKRITAKKLPVHSLYFVVNRGKRYELVAGIKNMKIVYGVTTKKVGVVNQYLEATEVSRQNLWSNVLSVVITLTPQEQSLPLKQWQIYIVLRERS